MILEIATYHSVFSVFVNSSKITMVLSQAEVDNIRMEYWKGDFTIHGSRITVFGTSPTMCQVRASRIFWAVEKAAEDKDNHAELSPVLPELLVTG